MFSFLVLGLFGISGLMVGSGVMVFSCMFVYILILGFLLRGFKWFVWLVVFYCVLSKFNFSDSWWGTITNTITIFIFLFDLLHPVH